MTGQQRAVFLDRDGTLNLEKNYLYKVEDWEWIPGAMEAIKQINAMGWLAIVVTNQAGIARGLYNEADVQMLHRHVAQLLAKADAKIDGYYLCPHHPEFSLNDCDCRKPEAGMLLRAAQDFSIDLNASYLIGDKASDIEAAHRVGVTPVLVATGYGAAESAKVAKTVMRARNVLEAVDMIRRHAV